MTSSPSPAPRATATSDLHARSFARFLQADAAPDQREDVGFEAAFRAHFPVTSADGLVELTYHGYLLEPPKYDAAECLRRGYTLAAPLKVVVRLVIWELDRGERVIRDIKEQEMYSGEVPLLTARGCFVAAGAERAPLLTAADDGRSLRLRAAGEHLAEAAAEGLATVTEKALERLERAIARDSADALMPFDLFNPKPLARAFLALLEKSPLVAPVDDTNPLARAAQAWALHLDDDTRDALDGPRAARWIIASEDGTSAALSPDAPVGGDGAVDAGAKGDGRPLAARFGGDDDALLRALPLAEAMALPDAVTSGRDVAVRGAALVLAARAGVVHQVSDRRVWVLDDGATEPTRYDLAPTRAPHGETPFALRPVVRAGQRVAAGDALAASALAADETLALGRRTAVTWRLDLPVGTCRVSTAGAAALRSVHRVLVDAWVRDTRLGVQELTRDVPGAAPNALRHLDASGLVALGATVEPGDVLAGVVSPEPDGSMRDDAVRATARATVAGVEAFARRGRERSERHAAIAAAMRADVEAERDECIAALEALGADELARDAAHWRYREAAEWLDRGDELPPGVVSLARIELLEERAVRCGDVLADGQGGRWTVREVGDAAGAEVELAGEGTGGEAYLMRLRADEAPAAKKPARKGKRA
ncbi:MAG: hypothetical protein U0324_27370 [Polyangiales bacterium]